MRSVFQPAHALTRRRVLAAASGAAFLPLCAAAPLYDAFVGRYAGGRAIRRFDRVQDAIAAAPANATVPYRILIGEGRFDEQVTINRPHVHLTGQGASRTTISFLAAAGLIAPDGQPWGTFRTATLSVNAPFAHLSRLTVENRFDAPAEMRRPGGMRADEGGSQQALALSLGRGADCTAIADCTFASHQDTVYCAEGRALFERCTILGSYDFIFGGAAARFERCEIRSRPRLDPVEGYIAAPSTMIDQPAGLVFDRCRLTREAGVPDGSVFLGRPWRLSTTVRGRRIGDVRSVGMAAYLRCTMDSHVAPSGWTRMWYTGADGNPRTWFEPEEARFCEYDNNGPGAAGSRRGTMLTAEAAARLSRSAMFGTWQPGTGAIQAV